MDADEGRYKEVNLSPAAMEFAASLEAAAALEQALWKLGASALCVEFDEAIMAEVKAMPPDPSSRLRALVGRVEEEGT